jgi:membrane protein implicated in regulation of membrane protease activity
MMGWGVWWVWVSAGLILAILEMVVPGFIFLGFAVGAVVVGILLALGGGVAAWLTSSISLLLVMFALFSLVAWLVLRRVVGVRRGQTRIVHHDVNDN